MSITLLIAGFVALFFVTLRLRKSRRLSPPGPKPFPIVGNIFDVPKERSWEKFSEWCRNYDSDVIRLYLPMQPMFILGSVKAAVDLLEKKSQIYSGRLRYIMAELMTWDIGIAIMPYGPRWRAHRRIFYQHFNQTSVRSYRPIQLEHARAMLMWLLNSPEHTPEHVQHAITSIVFTTIYGTRIPTMDHEYVVTTQIAVEGFDQALIPAQWLVDYLPILKYIPSWMPGANFKKFAKKYVPYVIASTVKPYNQVKEAMQGGVAPPSLAKTLIEDVRTKYGKISDQSTFDEIAKNVAGNAYTAGVDTTASSLKVFLLGMALFPEVQRKAQLELDRVVSQVRLPDFDDVPNMPYIRAVVMETLRWLPVGPLGVPHVVMADDTYRGYHIPKGAAIVANLWGMTHNAEDYPEPEEFKPERFLADDGRLLTSARDPSTIVFGFGRRICAGKHFAVDTLTIFIASILHVFTIDAGIDASGRPVELSNEVISGLVIEPRHIPCGLHPRSEESARLIHEAVSKLDEVWRQG